MLIYSLFALLQGLTSSKLVVIGGMVGSIYSIWAIGHFFGKEKKWNYIKAFFAYFLGMLTFALTAILLGFSIDWVIKYFNF